MNLRIQRHIYYFEQYYQYNEVKCHESTTSQVNGSNIDSLTDKLIRDCGTNSTDVFRKNTESQMERLEQFLLDIKKIDVEAKIQHEKYTIDKESTSEKCDNRT